MNPDLLQVGLLNIAAGVLGVVLGIPLALGKVGMNRWYGIRIRKAFSSPENWRKINAYGGRAFIYWSLPLLPLGVGVLLAGFYISRTDILDPMVSVGAALMCAAMVMGATFQTMAWSKSLPD